MYLINELKLILDNGVILIFLIISYYLNFKTSKQLKRNNYHRDYKIVRATGILYGILAIAAAVVINR